MKFMKSLLSVGLVLSLSSLSFAASVDAKVGIQNIPAGQTVSPVKGNFNGSLGIGETEAKYEQQVREGNTYTCSDLAGTSITTVAGLGGGIGAVGPHFLTLVNPIGSGVYLSILQGNVTPTAAPAAATGFYWDFNVLNSTGVGVTTAATLQNNQIGSLTVGKGLCYRVATLPAAPVAFRYFGGTTGAAAISGATFTDLVDGQILVPPGGIISLDAISATVGVAHIVYAEIPYP